MLFMFFCRHSLNTTFIAFLNYFKVLGSYYQQQKSERMCNLPKCKSARFALEYVEKMKLTKTSIVNNSLRL